MNFKTTWALLVLLASGAGLLWTGLVLPPALDPLPEEHPLAVADAGSRRILTARSPLNSSASKSSEARSAPS